MRRTILLLIIAIMASPAFSQVYMGAGVGYGSTTQPTSPPSNVNNAFVENNYQRSSSMAALFVGYRFGHVGIEAGALMLPQEHTTAYTWDYPSYAGVAPGTYPQTISIAHDVYSRAAYLRGNLYGPKISVFTPYVFYGKVRVHNYSHEYGIYNGTDKVDYEVSFTNNTFIHGVGLQVEIQGSWSARVEYTQIPKATVEVHTRERFVQFVTLNAVRSF